MNEKHLLFTKLKWKETFSFHNNGENWADLMSLSEKGWAICFAFSEMKMYFFSLHYTLQNERWLKVETFTHYACPSSKRWNDETNGNWQIGSKIFLLILYKNPSKIFVWIFFQSLLCYICMHSVSNQDDD